MLPPFSPQKYVDFSIPENRKKMEDALAKVKSELGREYDLIIGGESVKSDATFKSVNPSEPSQVIGVFQKATPELAKKAIDLAHERFDSWRWMPVQERSSILLRAAALARKRMFELAAWQILEVGKNWLEAIADVAEMIDMFEFYAREMIRYNQRDDLTHLPGEFNQIKYIPLGVCVVIPPWNFPMAILGGMTSAALVAGNTVVLKPSSDSPACGWQVANLLYEAGLPKDVLNFVTGSGAVAGVHMVEHPKTRLIAFTGSMQVGLDIVERAAKTMPGQIWIKRVIAEMGGKDFVMVDETADLDAAATGIVVSAFGFQGQKCSAGSRAIIFDSVYDEVIERVVEQTKKITIGPVEKYENWLGPVINERAEKNILGYIEIGKSEGKLLTGGNKVSDLPGYFIEPTVFGDVKPGARIEQEEIFGPVLTVVRVKDLDEGIKVANGTVYGLTGSYYSRDRSRIHRAKRELHVGNLYINRKSTGAIVDVHPFGGFNMSGTDSKAGGRDYLLLFTQAKSISEKLDY